ncbi:regulatory protein YycH of two-component signal transduction system YycFG [Geomicrobium halophilum]|uniref:Regulatory protein YycH of two-component signal transduction system YycFG n=1 Tax=Geomicrobium halophilum TaxID=549000 RepID=A0A841PTS7_9BACL|nr:regulatory protein YycH of two-component signal transduction system YycFG [Geomicrobium halophilum]
MVEQIKTAILSLLIIVSLILTWQVWTYQPELDLLEGEGYEESEPLSEPVSMDEVIGPANVTFHRNYEYWMTHGYDRFIIDEMMDELLSSEWSDFQLLEDARQHQIYNGNDDMIEFIFPTDIPLQVLEPSFVEDDEELMEELSGTFTFERVLISDEGGNRLRIQLVSFKDQLVLDGYTDMDIEQFQEEFMMRMEGSHVYQVFQQYVGSTNGGLSKPVYLPIESVTHPRYQYYSQDIEGEQLINYLFASRESVIGPEEDDGGELYRASDRQMRISRYQNHLEFIQPQTQGSSTNNDYQIVSNAYNFVNGHGGFTEQFQLYDWDLSLQDGNTLFRMMMDGLPVLETNVGRDYSAIQVEQKNGEISHYERPAFSLHEDPIATEDVELPDGETVLAEIEEQNNFDLSDIQDIRVGYQLQRGTFAIFSPHWYVKRDNNWYLLENGDQDQEVDANGLE